MLKNKKILLSIFLILLILILPTMVNAAVEYTRTIKGNDGSITLNLTGLELDTTKEHEFALVISGATPSTWHTVTKKTATTAEIELSSSTTDILSVLKKADEGYLYVREKDNTSEYEVNNLKIDLKLPYLNAVNVNVGTAGGIEAVKPIYDGYKTSNMMYKWEKITDKTVVEKYLKCNKNTAEISASDLKQTVPTSGFTNNWPWLSSDHGGFYSRDLPTDGLYYLWVKQSADSCRTIYGYYLYDGLPNATTVAEYISDDSVTLSSITLPSTAKIELGKTLTLTPTFTPTNATNKVVTWTSSDKSVATVDNAGKVTPVKVGQTVITVTSSENSSIKATCTVTVTTASANNESGSGNRK